MRIRNLRDRIQFRRSALSDDGFSRVESFSDYGDPVWAKYQDIGDGERWRAGGLEANVTSRFTVRRTSFTRALTPKDEIQFDGDDYKIFGIKRSEKDRRFLEITAGRRVDT